MRTVVSEPNWQLGARLDRLPVSRWHHGLVVVVGLGAFFDLYEVFLGGVLGAVLTRQWHLSTAESSLVVSSVFIGMFVGVIGLGTAADRYGRRRLFLVNLAGYSLFSLLAAFSPNLWVLVGLRILSGVALGAELTLIGAYLGEFMPARARGRAVAWAFTVGFCGIPVSAFLGGRFVATGHFLMDGWRWLLVLGGLGALIAWALRRRLPESPRWLAARGQVEAAERVVAGIEASVRRETGEPLQPPTMVAAGTVGPAAVTPAGVRQRRVPVISAMFRAGYRRRTVMLWVFHMLQTVGYYGFGSLAPLVLVAKGFPIVASLGYVGLSFLGYPIGAALAIPIIERVERRWLIVVSALSMALLGLVFGWARQPAVIVAAGFALTVTSNVFAAAFYTYQSELYPTAIRASSVGVAYSLSRAVAAALPFAALTVLRRYGADAVYVGSAIVLVVLCLDVALLGPPSTGRPLESASTATVPVRREDR